MLAVALTLWSRVTGSGGGASTPTADFTLPANSQYVALLFEDF